MYKTITKWEIFIPASDAGSLNKTVTVEAVNWIDALNAGLSQLGQTGTVTSNVMLDIKDGAFHVTDLQYHRVFEVRPLSTREVEGEARPRYTPPPPAPAAAKRPSVPPESVATTRLKPPKLDGGKARPSSAPPGPAAAETAGAPAPKKVEAPPETRGQAGTPAVTVTSLGPQRSRTPVGSDFVETQRLVREKRPTGQVELGAAEAAPELEARAKAIEVPAQRDLVAHKIFFVRDDEPCERSRLTYRERLIAVSPGTTRAQAEGLLTHYFKQLKKQIKSSPRGKFINLAVFDHVFHARALRPAIAALDWKDWKREPSISFPLETPSVVETSHIPGVERQPVEPPATGGDEPSQQPEAAAEPAPTVVELTAPMQVVEPPATFTPWMPAPHHEPQARREQPEPQPPPAAPEPEPRRAEDRKRHKTAEEPKRKTKRGKDEQRRAGKAEPAPQPPISRTDHVAVVPQPPPAVELGIGRHSQPPDLNELLVEVFEAMQDLYFVKTTQGAIQFAIDLISDKIPCERIAGFARIPDEPLKMVCVAARGDGTEGLLGTKVSVAKGTLLGLAIRQEIAVSISDVQNDRRIKAELEQLITENTRSALCSPFTFEGRTFGAVELVNRRGGDHWSQGEVHIVSYVANHLAEYIALSLETHEDFAKHFEHVAGPAPVAQPRPAPSAAKAVVAPAPQPKKSDSGAQKKRTRKKR